MPRPEQDRTRDWKSSALPGPIQGVVTSRSRWHVGITWASLKGEVLGAMGPPFPRPLTR